MVLPLKNSVNFCKCGNLFEAEKTFKVAKRIKSVTYIKSSVKYNIKEL